MHALEGGSADGQLFVYGGKGALEELRRQGKRHKRRHHGKGSNRTHFRGGKGKVKKHVGLLADTWLFDSSANEWKPQVPLPQDRPAARWKSEATAIGNGRLALFGGCKKNGVEGVTAGLWVFQPSTSDGNSSWRRVRVANAPPARRGHIVAANRSHLLVLGGKSDDDSVACSRDSWALPLAALEPGAGKDFWWTQGADFPGECRWGSTGTIIRKQGRELLAVFGGRVKRKREGAQQGAAGGAYQKGYMYFNELWLHDPELQTWSLAQSTVAPLARDHHGAARVGDDLFVFGGRSRPTRKRAADLQDVWSYSASTGQWTQHTAAGRWPSRRFMPGVAGVDSWHGGDAALLVFGGESLPGSTKSATLNDLWAFQPRSGWEMIRKSDCKATPLMNDGTLADFFVQAPARMSSAQSASSAAMVAFVMISCCVLAGAVSFWSSSLWRHKRGTTGRHDLLIPLSS